jgi:hypothetical protein
MSSNRGGRGFGGRGPPPHMYYRYLNKKYLNVAEYLDSLPDNIAASKYI